MLKTLLKYKPLINLSSLVRTKVVKYQQLVLNSVKEEIEHLETRLQKTKTVIDVQDNTILRDIPPIAGIIGEYMQFKIRIDKSRQDLQRILGSEWQETPDGSALDHRYSLLEQNLNFKDVLGVWIKSFPLNIDTELNIPIIKLLDKKNHDSTIYELHTNFEFSMGSTFKEVRRLRFMGFDLPSNVLQVSKNYKKIYPHALLLHEQLQTFLSLISELTNRKYTSLLYKNEIEIIWSLLVIALKTTWSSLLDKDILEDRIGTTTIILRLESSISDLIKRFDSLSIFEIKLETIFRGIKDSCYTEERFSKFTHDVKGILNDLFTCNIESVPEYWNYIQTLIDNVLYGNLKKALNISLFSQQKLVLNFRNQNIDITPSLKNVKTIWIRELDCLLLRASSIPQLLNTPDSSEQENRFLSIYKHLKNDIRNILDNIELIFQQSNLYVDKWVSHLNLWQVSESAIRANIADSLGTCYLFLSGLLLSRAKFERLQDENCISPILEMEIQNAYIYISAKYDCWQDLLSNELLTLYLKETAPFLKHINGSVKKIESLRLNVNSLDAIYDLATASNVINENASERIDQVSIFANTHKLLLRVRADLPANYIPIEQIENYLDMLTENTHKLQNYLQEKRDDTLHTLEIEIDHINDLSNALLHDWLQKKPVSEEITPDMALATIEVFLESFENVASRRRQLITIKKLLLLPLMDPKECTDCIADIHQYKNMWVSIKELWEKLEKLLARTWNSISLPDLSLEISYLSKLTETINPTIAKFELFQSIKTKVEIINTWRTLLSDLKNPALKPRHWGQYFNELSGNIISEANLESFSFTLNDIVSVNINEYEPKIRTVIRNAQNEFVVEGSLNRIKSYWKNAKYTFSEHSSSVRLVQEWDSIQESCRNNLDELAAMRNSQYFQLFQQLCLELESKLTQFSELQSLWIECQFYWLDLYGIIGNNKEMQTLLPLETSKFNSVTTDFKNFTTRAFNLKASVDILHIPGIMETLKLVLASLNLIRSSLNDFLEKQRTYFPRFYFLGNEELLKIIGCRGDVSSISKYMPKLYGSISSLVVAGNVVKGVVSPEDETLPLNNPINLLAFNNYYEWLNQLDMEIKLSIASQISTCLEKSSNLLTGLQVYKLIQTHIFQAVLVTIQVKWTNYIEQNIEASFQSIRIKTTT